MPEWFKETIFTCNLLSFHLYFQLHFNFPWLLIYVLKFIYVFFMTFQWSLCPVLFWYHIFYYCSFVISFDIKKEKTSSLVIFVAVFVYKFDCILLSQYSSRRSLISLLFLHGKNVIVIFLEITLKYKINCKNLVSFKYQIFSSSDTTCFSKYLSHLLYHFLIFCLLF